MTDAPTPDPAQRRKFALLILSLALALALILVVLVLLNRQWWMLAFLLVLIPNLYIGLRELRASRQL